MISCSIDSEKGRQGAFSANSGSIDIHIEMVKITSNHMLNIVALKVNDHRYVHCVCMKYFPFLINQP